MRGLFTYYRLKSAPKRFNWDTCPPPTILFKWGRRESLFLRFSHPALKDGVNIEYLSRYNILLTLSFRAGVMNKQDLGVLTPFRSEFIP